jgi:hypothetical protein
MDTNKNTDYRDFEPYGEIYGDTGDYCTEKDGDGICGGILKESYVSNQWGYWKEWTCGKCEATWSE